MSQSDLSKLERRGDVRVSTVAAVARALGGGLRLIVRDDHGDHEVRVGRRTAEAGCPPPGEPHR